MVGTQAACPMVGTPAACPMKVFEKAEKSSPVLPAAPFDTFVLRMRLAEQGSETLLKRFLRVEKSPFDTSFTWFRSTQADFSTRQYPFTPQARWQALPTYSCWR